MRLKIAAVAAASMIALAACSSSTDTATPASPTATADTMSESASPAAPTEAGTIVDVAAGNPDFSTLVAAVEAAGLAETLSGEGPFTVFAPTNAAFDALPAGLLDSLLKPENKDALTKILTYHVVAGEVTSGAITPGDVPTVEGQDLAIAVDGGTVTVNDATVVTADVPASNGVIHVIDAVLVPSDVDVSAL